MRLLERARVTINAFSISVLLLSIEMEHYYYPQAPANATNESRSQYCNACITSSTSFTRSSKSVIQKPGRTASPLK